MKRRLKTILKVSLAGGVALLLIAGGLYLYLRPGVTFLTRLTDTQTAPRQLGDPWSEKGLLIDGTIRGRIYRPQEGDGRVILLVHGVHWGGIDEVRLVPLARKLAGMGYTVVTPEIIDLKSYEITLRSVDMIEKAALWTVGQVANGEKIGIMGISFGGGLSVSAAGRPALKNKLAYVISFGGHADLDRVMRYLCTGKLPDGGELPAHIYAVAVLLRQAADKLVPADQVALMRRWLDLYLMDKKQEAAEQLKTLPSPARELATHCYQRESSVLGQRLLPHVTRHVSDSWLSPMRCPPPDCPVFLLHGTVDNVIPPTESTWLGAHLAGNAGSHVLLSPLVVHVEVEGHNWRDMLKLVWFATRWLRS